MVTSTPSVTAVMRIIWSTFINLPIFGDDGGRELPGRAIGGLDLAQQSGFNHCDAGENALDNGWNIDETNASAKECFDCNLVGGIEQRGRSTAALHRLGRQPQTWE